MIKSKKKPEVIVRKAKPAVVKVAPVKIDKLAEAKEIITKLIQLYPDATGKTWDRAKDFIA